MTEGFLRPYLFVVDSTQISLKSALDIIDDLPQIENWQKILPDGAVLISRIPVQDLNAVLKGKLPKQRYILTLLEQGKKSGWLAKSSWEFINNPASVFD